MVTHEDGLVSFRSVHGRYMGTEHYGSVRAQAWNAGWSERFRLEFHGKGHIALRCSNDRYLSTVDACHLNRVQRGCFKREVAFSPLDLSTQPMTREASAPACQARCRATGGCRHFTFASIGGYCHLASSHVLEVTNSPGTIAGPDDCDQPSYVVLQGSPHDKEILPRAGTSQVKIGPLDGKMPFCIFTLASLPALFIVVARWCLCDCHHFHGRKGHRYQAARLLQAKAVLSNEVVD